ncbi:hypothetical protein V5O48_015852 [Marasmius crinis-equi]|uniref:Uncharacterized protein n=1 Tax=Marasmius crinis-equi TaxID=585013 RepID=A0ABR3ETF6_9AGAR
MAAHIHMPQDAGHKTILQSRNAPPIALPNLDTTTPPKLTKLASMAALSRPRKPSQPEISLLPPDLKPCRAGLQTRVSNKDVHPADVVKEYTQVRRTAAEVKADKDKKQL